jgi:energy-converting hydrogenase Eha subunit C
MKDFSFLTGALCIMVAVQGFLDTLYHDTIGTSICVSALFLGYVIHDRSSK